MSEVVKQVELLLPAGTVAYTSTKYNLTEDTGFTPAHPMESRAAGVQVPTGRAYDVTVGLKNGQSISAYVEVFVGNVNEAVAPGGAGSSYTTLGVPDDGSLEYEAVSRDTAAMLPLGRGHRLNGQINILTQALAKYTAASSRNATDVSLALKRNDGTYKIINNVRLTVGSLGPTGTDRTEVFQIYFGGSYDVGDVPFADEASLLLGDQATVDWLFGFEAGAIRFTFMNDVKVKLDPARLLVNFEEEFGSGNATTLRLTGRAYAATNAVATRTPALL